MKLRNIIRMTVNLVLLMKVPNIVFPVNRFLISNHYTIYLDEISKSFTILLKVKVDQLRPTHKQS